MKALPKFAIALEYDGKQAPQVTARGHDEIANQILRLAQEADVPIHLDKDLALVLDQIDVGEHIPEALYLVIAEILTFAYRVSDKHKDFMDDIKMQSQPQLEPPPAPENG
ncbi:MAG: EscU/YscU/HrcU family type III secretion system export apparatus switch protein [Gammaproteobacteria bacterium]|nr:EscU/YscU/HrcU family type III secretion system export apparatus switch protein [Gammaproteobacteria bacterium]